MCDFWISVVSACPWDLHFVSFLIDWDHCTVTRAASLCWPGAQLGSNQWSVINDQELTVIWPFTVCVHVHVHTYSPACFQLDLCWRGKSCKVKRKRCCVFILKVCILINTLFKPCGKHMGSSNINAVCVVWRPPPHSQHTHTRTLANKIKWCNRKVNSVVMWWASAENFVIPFGIP